MLACSPATPSTPRSRRRPSTTTSRTGASRRRRSSRCAPSTGSSSAHPPDASVHPDYPLLLPLTYDVIAVLRNGWNDAHLGIVHVAFAAALLLVFHGSALDETRSRIAAAFIAIALVPLAATPWIGMAEGRSSPTSPRRCSDPARRCDARRVAPRPRGIDEKRRPDPDRCRRDRPSLCGTKTRRSAPLAGRRDRDAVARRAAAAPAADGHRHRQRHRANHRACARSAPDSSPRWRPGRSASRCTGWRCWREARSRSVRSSRASASCSSRYSCSWPVTSARYLATPFDVGVARHVVVGTARRASHAGADVRRAGAPRAKASTAPTHPTRS